MHGGLRFPSRLRNTFCTHQAPIFSVPAMVVPAHTLTSTPALTDPKIGVVTRWSSFFLCCVSLFEYNSCNLFLFFSGSANLVSFRADARSTVSGREVDIADKSDEHTKLHGCGLKHIDYDCLIVRYLCADAEISPFTESCVGIFFCILTSCLAEKTKICVHGEH